MAHPRCCYRWIVDTDSARSRVRAGALLTDVVIVVGFVLLGRHNHHESSALGATAAVAAPFLIGLAIGWLLGSTRWAPTTLAFGVVVWLSTVGLGIVLRSTVFGRSSAGAFVGVATVFLGVTLVGWRLAAFVIERRRSGFASGRSD